MTVVACVTARNVSRVLAGGDDTIVAGATTPYYLRVIDGERGRPNRRAMAIFADNGRQNVCRALASRFYAVVTADAVTEDVHVIEIRRQPGAGDVAVVAGVATCYVSRVLAGGTYAIVAPDTVAGNAAVIENGRQPGCGIVTIIALIP